MIITSQINGITYDNNNNNIHNRICNTRDMIQKYTKKPVTIEAIQFKEENIPTIKDWLGENLAQLSSEDRYRNPQYHWIIRDYLEGDMKITEGDYIIRGVNGEFYPCKPDIFYATYNGPVKVLWNHTTGEYDQEYLSKGI